MQPKPFLSALSRDQWVRLAIVADLLLIAFLLASGFHGRWSFRDWQTPVQYGSEGGRFSAVVAGVKSATQGHYLPFISQKISQFGAPHGANWGGNPGAEQAQVLVAAVIAKVVGVFTAVNLLVIMAHVLAVLGFYAACRALGYSWEWSGAGALLFGFASFVFAWGDQHLSVAYVAHVPLLIVVFHWAIGSRGGVLESEPEPANRRAKKKSKRGLEAPEAVVKPVIPEGTGLMSTRCFYWALGIAILTGFCHDSYTNLFAQLMAMAALYHALQKRWICARRVAIVAVAALAVCFFFNSLSGSHREGIESVAATQQVRALESSGFKLADLFIAPPTHWFTPAARWGERYAVEVALKTETPGAAYLGIAGIAAFLWLAGMSIRKIGSQPPQRPPIEAFVIAAIIVYAAVGGAGVWASSLGLPLLPTGNRVVIGILALALMFAVRELSGMTAGWKTPTRLALAGIIVLVGLWDQVPRGLTARQEPIAKAVDSDRAFTREMEARLKPDSMVFQMPVLGIQEDSMLGEPTNPATRAFQSSRNPAGPSTILPYDHFRPFFYSKALRFSSGDLRSPQNAWQSDLALLQPAALMDRLESYGFSAVYLNASATPDRGEALLKTAATRKSPVIHSRASDLVCVILKPSSSPVTPPIPPFFGSGWFEQDVDAAGRVQHYCTDVGELVLTNPKPESADVTMICSLVGIDYRVVRISVGNTFFEPMQVKPGRALRVEKKVTLRPGENLFTFSSDRAPVLTARGNVSFVVADFQITGK